MIYEDYYLISELNRWSVEEDIPWDRLDLDAAGGQPELLDQIRESALIEAIHPITTKHLMGLLWDDVDATSILSVELYEGFRHFHVLRMYLDRVGHEPSITDEEIVRARSKATEAVGDNPDLTQELVNFIFSEHFAAYYFVRLRQRAQDPVLREIAHLISRDEFRHTQISQDLLKRRIEQHQESVDQILHAAANFQHYGAMALEEVPVFQRGDLGAIRSFMKKIELLTGRRVVDYLKERLPENA
jgi:hypothetical protein